MRHIDKKHKAMQRFVEAQEDGADNFDAFEEATIGRSEKIRTDVAETLLWIEENRREETDFQEYLVSSLDGPKFERP